MVVLRRFNPEIHHRRSTRLKGFDYSQEGCYFITTCVKNREKILSKICDGKVILSEFGIITEKALLDLPIYNSGICIDEFIIMPDHVHILMIINGPLMSRRKKKSIRLSELIRQFKTYSSFGINKIRKKGGYPFWQRNYYDRISRIREPEIFRRYIRNNPLKYSKGKNS